MQSLAGVERVTLFGVRSAVLHFKGGQDVRVVVRNADEERLKKEQARKAKALLETGQD